MTTAIFSRDEMRSLKEAGQKRRKEKKQVGLVKGKDCVWR